MLRAWRRARAGLSATPPLDLRWTRTCLCGRDTATGKVDTKGKEGIGFLTGSEEGRGPLYDVTHVPLEGVTSPISDPVQGDKVIVPVGSPPPAVPIAVVRVGDGAIAAIPGEPTKEMGARVKLAVLQAMARAGVQRVVIAGLADDYIQYLTTPEEYGQQSYEGASTVFGPNEATFLQEQLVDLATRLVEGRPAPEPYPLDVSYGVHPDGPAYPPGADHGTIAAQPPVRVRRLGHATLSWQGGPSGHDRPVGSAFVVAERRVGARWTTADTDLGLKMLWRVDAQGRYHAEWEVPLDAPLGTYRLVVTATRYRLASDAFAVAPLTSLGLETAPAGPGRVAVRLVYPKPVANVDLTSRPVAAAGGSVRFRVGDRTVEVRRPHGTVFSVAAPAGTPVSIPAKAAHDRFGNTNGSTVTLAGG